MIKNWFDDGGDDHGGLKLYLSQNATMLYTNCQISDRVFLTKYTKYQSKPSQIPSSLKTIIGSVF